MLQKQVWLWEKGVRSGFQSGTAFFPVLVRVHQSQRSHDAVGEILKAVVELGSDGTHGAIHHLLHQHLQLLLRQIHVETLLQVTDGAGTVEAGKLRTCRTYKLLCKKN